MTAPTTGVPADPWYAMERFAEAALAYGTVRGANTATAYAETWLALRDAIAAYGLECAAEGEAQIGYMRQSLREAEDRISQRNATIIEAKKETHRARVALADAEARAERLRLEAQAWAQEARAQRATVREAYQVATGATGEPGDWRGAKPIRDRIAVARAKARAEALAEIDAAAERLAEGDECVTLRCDATTHLTGTRWWVPGDDGDHVTPTAAILAAAAALDAGEGDDGR